MIILTDCGTVENSENQEIYLLGGAQEEAIRDAGWTIHTRIYKITYQHKEYEIHCPEIAMQNTAAEKAVLAPSLASWRHMITAAKESGAQERILILPEWLTPHRPYPTYVYLYAIHLYCSEPSISQREAAQRTRAYFGLETFSHTTLGRALKALDTAIVQAESAKDDSSALGDMDGEATAAPETNKSGEPAKATSFPARQDTEKKRRRVLGFFEGRLQAKSRREFEIAANTLVRAWFLKTRRLIFWNCTKGP